MQKHSFVSRLAYEMLFIILLYFHECFYSIVRLVFKMV